MLSQPQPMRWRKLSAQDGEDETTEEEDTSSDRHHCIIADPELSQDTVEHHAAGHPDADATDHCPLKLSHW